MPITSEAELRRVVAQVSGGLADIQAYLGDRTHEDGKIRFPRGYIRTAQSIRSQLWFIRDETVRRNLAYAHLQSDTLRWLLNRTDLAGTAKEMVIKEFICLAAAISETLTKQVCIQERLCGKKKGFKERCDVLADFRAISEATGNEAKWLWDFRQNEHIFLATDWEYGYYKMTECNRAIKCLRSLKSEIGAWFTEHMLF